MEAQALALEEEVRQLCGQEQTKHTALMKQRLYSRVGQFLMGSLDMRHWWCGYSTLMVFMMRVLELYPTTESVCVFYKKMEQQLRMCRKCVDIYHASMPSVHVELEFEFTPDSIKLFFIKVQGMDADRIQRQLVVDTSLGASSEIVALTLYEILTQRRLLSDFRIIRVLSKWTSSQFSDVNTNPSLESLRGCAGLYLLMISPDSAVREWAKKMVQHFGKIQLTGDDGERHDLLNVLDEWMCILENEEFNKSLLLLDINTTKDLQDFLEPTNCVKTPTKPILWSALDHLIQQMDINSLEVMLDSFDTIPDVAFNYLQDADPAGDQTVTLMVSKCFAVLLRCLGHRFWNYSVYSPKAVIDVVMQHCRLGSWRLYVTKQFIELLPLLLVAIRPPQVTSQASSEENQEKLDFYLQTRKEILQFLILKDRRPKHYDAVATVATSRAAFTVLIDCYEHRMPGSVKTKCISGREEGALSSSYFIDYSISESAFWWPCSSGPQDKTNELVEELWMDHLFHIVVKPNNVESLVDLAAETTALILSKHLQLARDLVYSNLAAEDPSPTEAVTKGKPIITHLLRKLCLWGTVTTIPLQVHGALFESIGGISELLNSIVAQLNPSDQLQEISKTLQNYEAHTKQYLQRMYDEVVLKGLVNPFSFPVVCQHINACSLSSTTGVDQMVKRLIGHCVADKNRPTQIPSHVEAFLISVHRNTEAFLRGQLAMLHFMRLYGFSMAVCLPAVKKLIFLWSKVFDMLSRDLEKVFTKALNATTSANQTIDTSAATTHLLKLPNLINDFLIALMTSMFDPNTKLTVEITEANRVQCLDFGISFWKFWTSVLKDPCVSTKRMVTLVTPLVECVARRSVSEKKRAADLLMTVLRCLLKGNICLDKATLAMIDSIKGEAASIESNQSTDFGAMTKKFRQLDQNSRFFVNRSTGMPNVKDMTSKSRVKVPARAESFASSNNSTARQIGGKVSAKGQGYALVDLTAADELSNEAAARKQHSFYSEEEYHTASTQASSSMKQASKSKSSFKISQIIEGISHSHPGSNKILASKKQLKQPISVAQSDEKKENEEDKDAGLRFAALFHRIKTTRKPVAVCSLLPFYRQLLQVCMPVLLSGEFQNERSEKELQVPALTFKKNADYVRAFLPLLLEECNNEVQESLRKCCDGSRGHLLRYESEKAREGMRCLNFTIAQKDEKLQATPREKFGGKKTGFHEKLFRNADVVLLQISMGSQNQRAFMGKREFLGVVLISETDKGRRQTSTAKKNTKDEDEESVKVLFLNDGELDNATASVRSFSTEVLAASAMTDTEWKVNPLCNLVTSAREYIALRSVDMLPEHLRTVILTPEAYKSTQSKLITITSVLDDMRLKKSSDSETEIVKILKRLGKIDVVLNDLRSTSIGKAVNKLRKHKNVEIKTLSGKLIEKWTSLMGANDTLEHAPRFLPPDLWEAIKPQYNSSQLQSIHNVLNNYSVGVSLLQGPPGTGKTKTIMGLLSGLLSIRLPATAVMPLASTNETKAQFDSFETARSRSVSSTGQSGGPPSSVRPTASTFSLNGVTSALGSILRRSSDSSGSRPSLTTIQSLKNVSTSRSRLENKLSARPTSQPHGNVVVKRRVISRATSDLSASRTNNILLCAPSNGAVNELVLRIVTDGLIDSTGNVTKVRAPSVHSEGLTDKVISIIRLGNAGEDASEAVNSVCLPQIIRREMAIHPKAMELHSLQETQRQLRSCIRNFHNKAEDADGSKKDRKALAKMHQQLTGCMGKLRRLRDEVTAIRAKMTETLLSKASIIACTLSKAGSGDFWGLKHGFDALIIDEAAQAVELSTLVPIRERVARVVLVGDPKQLPATVKSVVAAKARYDRSLFERIADSGVAPSMLRVQYRMHPFLREFPSKRFYGGMLTDGPSVMERVQQVCPGVYAHTSFQPFLVYDVDNSQEEDMNGSKYNRVEAAFCVSLCQHMFETCQEVRTNKWSVGFVSPYKEQVRIIRQEVTRSSIPTNVSIEVNTVDGFQGREKDVIVFSCVRSSQRGGIGFLRDIRRLNVAITRARFCLYVIGNVNTLMRDETWAALIKSAQDRQLIIRTDGDEFPRVVQRLKGDRYRDLSEHYQSMHEKAAQKATSTVKPTKSSAKNVPANSKSELVLPEETSVKTFETTDRSDEASCAPVDNDTEALNDNIASCGSTSSCLDKRQAQVEVTRNLNDLSKQPVDNLKRSAEESLNVMSAKKPRTEAGSRIQSHSSTTDSRQHRENRFHERVLPDRRLWNEPASALQKDTRREDSSKFRDSFDRKRGDRGYDRDDRHEYDSRKRNAARGELEQTSQSPSTSLAIEAPLSISEKEFCQVNEPLPPLRPVIPTKRTSRPYQEALHRSRPPNLRNRDRSFDRHDRRSSSSRTNYRFVTKDSSTETKHSNTSTGRTPPTGRSTTVLDNILGSASKLASSTSRVNDKNKPRSSDFC